MLSVAYSPDGKHIASASADKTVKIWDSADRQIGEGPSLCIALSFAAACTDADVRWLVDEQKCTLRGHSDCVTSVAYSPDGKHIVSGSRDNTVKIWDAQSGEEVRVVV